MAPNKSPAFQFYPKDFLSGTATMSLQEVGAYVRLLCYAWDTGSVPAEGDERARIMVCSKAQERELWKKVGKKFVLVNDVYLNERMEDERQKQAEYRRRQSDKGKASGLARTGREPDVNHGSTAVQPEHEPDANRKATLLFSSSSSSSVDPSKNDGSRGVPSAPRPQPIIDRRENEKWAKKHGYHVAGFCDWCCLDEQQAAEFAGKIPGDDHALKLKQIKEWALDIRRKWSDRINPDGSHFEFWRNRWTETHGGSRPANATLKAARAAADLDEAFK